MINDEKARRPLVPCSPHQAETGGLCGDDLPAGGPHGEPKAGKSPPGSFGVNPNHSRRCQRKEQKDRPDACC